MSYIVAVHTGAGNTSHQTNTSLKTLCKRVCNDVAKLLRHGKSASDAAIAGTVLLENAPLTNAGLGSSITHDHKIRTEASLCSNISGFHCAGDLENIRHPIKIVELMVKETMKSKSSMYIPPRIMVGQSAIDWYSSIDSSITQSNICTKRSVNLFYKAHKYFTARPSKRQKTSGTSDNFVTKSDDDLAGRGNTHDLEIKENTPDNKALLAKGDNDTHKPGDDELCDIETLDDTQNVLDDCVQDTVGVVCIDSNSDIACAMSSGGSVYKYSGRLGQCCVHGAGSYVTPNIGIVTTGNGEQIINKLLAITLANKLSSCTNPLDVLSACFTADEARMCGMLMVERGADGAVTVHAQHTLTNMVVGYVSSSMEAPVARVLSQSSPVFLQSLKM